MADVFLAAVEGPVGAGFTKLAVVKKLRTHLAEDPDFVAMLVDEARLTSRLSHPNVVQLFEFAHVDGQYFLAIEHLEGKPLHRIDSRVRRKGAQMPREVYYAIIADVLAGLHYAHELADYDGTPLEVVHRDVTPHNIFVTYDGTVKVVDFGIAKAVGRSTETKHGIVKGKIRYMSPEQATGSDVDRRTDVFAVGVILWNAVTGLKLWGGLDDIAVAHGLSEGKYPASPRASCSDVPEEIDAICRKALAFRKEDRYATAAEMQADLEAVLARVGSDPRKQLASLMKDLFEGDRAKLRAVLEASGLTSAASVDAFTGGSGSRAREQRSDKPRADAPRADAPRADGPRADAPRADGPRAAQRPAAAVPEPAPAAAAAASAPPLAVTPRVARKKKDGASKQKARSARRRTRLINAVASGVSALFVAVAAWVVLSNRSVAPSAPRNAHDVASDLTTLSSDPAAKVSDPIADDPRPGEHGPLRRAHGTRGKKSSPASGEPSQPSPGALPTFDASRPSKLDDGDPWSGSPPENR
jgi:serine/threonine protein kinase